MINNKKELYEQLYRRYYAPLCVWAGRFIDDIPRCQDIVSDVFARLWFKGKKFILKEETALSYLKVSVRNECLKRRSRERLRPGIDEEYPIYAESPDSLYSLSEMYDMLLKAVNELPEVQRRVFYESFINRKKESEVAEAIGMSGKTVERYRARIVGFLRARLK